MLVLCIFISLACCWDFELALCRNSTHTNHYCTALIWMVHKEMQVTCVYCESIKSFN